MNNQYLFFESQDFADADLSGFTKTDTPIPKTPVYIYDFEYQSSGEISEEEEAKKLDELTQQFARLYPDKFQTILSSSSQCFCRMLYPLVVKFETTIRRVFYISKSFSENGKVDKDTFLLDSDKKRKPIEELDFGKIYDAIFVDAELKSRVIKSYDRALTKEDLIRRINNLEEVSMWRRLVGSDYDFVEKSFLSIESYRNDVMHSHLIDYSTFIQARAVFERAIEELEKAISEKLISNDGTGPNLAGIYEAVKIFYSSLYYFSKKLNEIDFARIYTALQRFFIVDTEEMKAINEKKGEEKPNNNEERPELLDDENED